ncbi:MAG: hypothetical protein P4L85_08190 [Paludisphaera borealis]|uniref:hypothetical protein n=1 Tax=Paludisphaera borealis TaxID=1387353 RepID=UPI00283CDD99|nr:hypothetical protein [Paludisphaera borealis]MDR3619315.1 hypothetical protein [Paludisphaera borealis]
MIAWLDSDVLIFDPLVELGLPHGDDFTARREWLPPAVLDESSVYLDHWKFSCDVLGMKWDDVPWIPADGLDKPQRLMFNSGVFAFRRGLGFAEAFADCTERLIRAGVAYGHGAYWHNEQHSLMFAMLRLGLRWRELPRSENHMIFNAQIDGEHAAPSCAEARLVHYSHSMDAPYWPRFLARLRRERPENLDWLAEHGPIENERVPRHPYALALKFSRNLRSRMQSKRSIRAVHEWKARQA